MLSRSELKEYGQDLTKMNMWNRNYINYINRTLICIQKWSCAEKSSLMENLNNTYNVLSSACGGISKGSCCVSAPQAAGGISFCTQLWCDMSTASLRRWLSDFMNGSTELQFYVATDAVWSLFTGLLHMFCSVLQNSIFSSCKLHPN